MQNCGILLRSGDAVPYINIAGISRRGKAISILTFVWYNDSDPSNKNMLELKPKSELEIQEKIINILEQLQRVSKKLLVLLAVVLVLALPLRLILRAAFFNLLSSNYSPPPIVYERPEPKPLRIIDKKILTAGNNRFFAYARIQNPNGALAVRSLPYEFVLYGIDGKEVERYSGVSYILPAQDKLIFMPAREFAEAPFRVEVNLDVEQWSKVSIKPLSFLFEQVEFGSDDGYFFVSALLRNDNPYIIPEVELAVILYNLQREVVGVNFTTINEVLPQESRFFRVIWPAGVQGEVADVEFKPAVNQLNPGALLTERVEGYDIYR